VKPYYPEGKYVCEILDQALAETSNKNPQFVLKFKVLGTVDPKDPNSYIAHPTQLERHYYRVFTENTMRFALDELEVLGFVGDAESFSQLDPRTPNFVDFSGKQIDMICSHKPDQQNAPREEWSIAREGMAAKQLPSDGVRKLDYQFGKLLKERKTGGLVSAPRPQNKPTPVAQSVGTAGNLEINDDDVPF
jgi:hypothetical protein